MGYREFVDDAGDVWKVWDVKPMVRNSPARGVEMASVDASEGARHVQPGYGNGWLAFQSDEASRRLRPIPKNWEITGEYSLRKYLSHAAAVRQQRSE